VKFVEDDSKLFNEEKKKKTTWFATFFGILVKVAERE